MKRILTTALAAAALLAATLAAPSASAAADVLPNLVSVATPDLQVAITYAAHPTRTSIANAGAFATLMIQDWVMVGRFFATLTVPWTDCAFSKADSSPLPCGNGRLSIQDWLQAGRYAAGQP